MTFKCGVNGGEMGTLLLWNPITGGDPVTVGENFGSFLAAPIYLIQAKKFGVKE